MPLLRTVLAALLCLAAACPALAGSDADWTFGGDVRVRGYALNNMWDADDAGDGDRWSLFRHRTRVFATGNLDRGVTAYVRLANQHWGEGVSDAAQWEVANKSDKVFVDNAWVRVPDLFDLPLTLRVGRQDLRYGTGFVIFDGQSQTGSTSAYLDGVKASLRFAEELSADLLYFKARENERSDLADDDVTLSGIYLRTGGLRARDVYVLRREDQSLDRDIVTAGLHLSTATGPVTLFAEGAVQRGDASAVRDQRAWGLTADARWQVPDAPGGLALLAGGTGFSGDDPSTPDTNERWDVMYGGWPRYGDILAWTNLNLGPGNAVSRWDPAYGDGSSTIGEAVYGNLIMLWTGVELRPSYDLTLRATYTGLRAHRSAVASKAVGDLVQFNAKYRWSREVALGLYAARLWPGEAYGIDADPIDEAFWELNVTF